MKLLVLGLLAVLLSACGGKDDSLKPAPLPVVESAFQPSSLWQAQVGAGTGKQRQELTLAFSRGVCFAADAFGQVMAFRQEDGAPLWSVQLPDSEPQQARSDGSFVSGAVGASSSALFLGTRHGIVFALSQIDGSVLWTADIASEVLAPPQSDGVLVYVQSVNGRLTALELKDGARRWVYDNSAPPLSLRGTNSPLPLGEGTVAAGFANGKVVVLNILDGSTLWDEWVATPEGSTELESIVDVDGRMQYASGLLYAASYQGKIRAFVANNGRILWELPFSAHRDLALDAANLYAADEDDHLHSIDRLTAGVNWVNDSLHRRRLSDPVIIKNYLTVADYQGYLHFLSQSDGRIVAHHRPVSGKILDLLAVGDRLFVLGANGSLQALHVGGEVEGGDS